MPKTIKIPNPPKDDDDDEEEIVVPVNPRNEILNQIADETRKTRDDNLIEAGLLEAPETINKLPNEDDLLGDGGQDKEKLHLDVDNLDSSTDTPVIERDGALFLSVIVDGETREIPISEAVTKVQKDSNVDVLNLQASNALKDAEALKKLYEEKIADASTQPDDRVTMTPEMKAKINDSLSILYNKGDVGEASELLIDALSEFSPRAVKPVDVTGTVKSEVAQQLDQEKLETAYEVFKGEDKYSNIVSDSFLKEKLDVQTEALLDDAEYMSGNPSYSQMLEKAGDEILDWIDKLSPPPSTQDSANVTELKRASANRRSTKTLRRGAPQPKVPPTTSEIISKIAEGRGQTTHS